MARDFEIVIARCGRGGREMPPDHYFATTNPSQLEMRARTSRTLWFDGYSGHGEATILSDGAEIMKRSLKALPIQSDRTCQLWRQISSGAPHFDQPGRICVSALPIPCCRASADRANIASVESRVLGWEETSKWTSNEFY